MRRAFSGSIGFGRMNPGRCPGLVSMTPSVSSHRAAHARVCQHVHARDDSHFTSGLPKTRLSSKVNLATDLYAMKLRALFCAIVAAAVSAVHGATLSWPGFRGPNSSGVSTEAKPPVKMSPTNSVLWKIQVPWSPSSPCIWGDQIFLTTFNENELQTRCYQRADGKQAWSRGLKPHKGEMYHSTEISPAASTPPTDVERVVSYCGSFG